MALEDVWKYSFTNLIKAISSREFKGWILTHLSKHMTVIDFHPERLEDLTPPMQFHESDNIMISFS